MAKGDDIQESSSQGILFERHLLNVTNPAGLSLQVEQRRKCISGRVRLAGRILNSEIGIQISEFKCPP